MPRRSMPRRSNNRRSNNRRSNNRRSNNRRSDLTQTQQRVIVAAGLAELVLTSVALRDLAHRPASAVRGSKPLWLVACVVQPFGPITYLTLGRDRQRPTTKV